LATTKWDLRIDMPSMRKSSKKRQLGLSQTRKRFIEAYLREGSTGIRFHNVSVNIVSILTTLDMCVIEELSKEGLEVNNFVANGVASCAVEWRLSLRPTYLNIL